MTIRYLAQTKQSTHYPFKALVVSFYALFLTFSSPIVFAQTSLKIVTEEAAPLQYLKDGRVEGLTTNVVREMLSRANISADIEIYPWARAIQIASSDANVLIFPMIRSPEREQQFIWLGKLLSFNLAFITLADTPEMVFENYSDLRNYRLATLRNDYSHQLLNQWGLKDHEDFQIVSEFSHLLRLLYANKIDTFIADYTLLRMTAKKLGYDPDLLIASDTIRGQQVPVYLAASKGTSETLISTLKTALKDVSSNTLNNQAIEQ